MRGRSLLDVEPVAVDDNLRQRIGSTAADERAASALAKDCHLIEAALHPDPHNPPHNPIVSKDKTARRLFTEAAIQVAQIRAIVWVNPTLLDEDTPIVWLEAGAPDEARRTLGYRAPS